jgi:phenylpropionate dioxygenase-like ring-hydroxylating dioxygenase large terminal subunit
MSMTSMSEAIGEDRVNRLNSSLGSAIGLPGRVYVDPSIWELERKTVFREGWFAVGFASEIPQPGDMLPVSTAGWELFFVRGRDGSIRGFHNICMHRGTKLVHEKKHGATIRCGWHCWTYDLEGALVATPLIGGPKVNEGEGIDRSTLSLKSVRTSVMWDVIYVNIDGQAADLQTYLAPLRQRLSGYDVDGYNLEASAGDNENIVNINWKLYHEGGLEGYHIPWVHPKLEQPNVYKVDEAKGVFISLSAELNNYQRLGTEKGTKPPVFPLNPEAQSALDSGKGLPYTIAFTPPTVIIAPWPDTFIVTLLRPLSMTQTGVRRRIYFRGDASTNPDFERARANIVKIWDDITGEDGAYSEAVQRLSSLRETLGINTRFSPYWESAVRAFQQYVVDAVREPAIQK